MEPALLTRPNLIANSKQETTTFQNAKYKEFLQPMFKRNVKGVLHNIKKTAILVHGGIPYLKKLKGICHILVLLVL